MKLFDRAVVEDTSPKVYIGRRIFNNRRGEAQVARNFYAECTHRGRTHYAPLRTANRSVAVHRAHVFSERVHDHGTAAAGAAGAAPEPMRRTIDLAELARSYLTMQHNRARKPKTLQKYEYTVAAFVAWAQSCFVGTAEQFTEALFWQWHKSMLDDGYAAKTRADRLTIIKQVFKWGLRQKLLSADPLVDARVPDPPSTPQPCFEPRQVSVLLAAADELERPVFATLAYTGMRFGEVRDLRWDDVNMPPDQPGDILIRAGGSDGTPKDHDARRIPLHPELRNILRSLPRRGERVFHSPPSTRYPDGGCPLNQSTMLARLKDLCARCGFARPQQYKLHTFRHVFASMCARNNVAYKYALGWMGHSSSEILDLYYKQFDDVAHQAIRTIDYPAAPTPQAPEEGS